MSFKARFLGFSRVQGVRSACTMFILLVLVAYTFAVAMVQLLQTKPIGQGTPGIQRVQNASIRPRSR